MKIYTKLAAASLLLTSVSACQSDLAEIMDENKATPISVTATDNAQLLKTTLLGQQVSWVAGIDKLGVYSAQAKPSENGLAKVSNAMFIAASSGVSAAFTGEMYWGKGEHTFYAYYPFHGGQTDHPFGADPANLPVCVPVYQQQNSATNDHIGALDFMVATPVTVAPGAESSKAKVNFKMNHVFSLLEFSITTGQGSARLYQIKITAKNDLAAYGKIDITQPTPTGNYSIKDAAGEKFIVLNVNGDCLLTNDPSTTAKAYMMILPGNLTGSNVEIQITTDKGVAVVTKSGKDFARGKKYKVEISAPSFDGKKVTDYDGNLYHSVTIGAQTWMAENLKTTTLNDGTPMDLATFSTTPGYRWYDDNITYKNIYGALYNGYAVKTGKLSPRGWHIPSKQELDALASYLGGKDVAGGKLKAVGTQYWQSPNTGATNETGFNALPGGYYNAGSGTVQYYDMGYYFSFWGKDLYTYLLDTNSGLLDNANDNLVNGNSVRCIKD